MKYGNHLLAPLALFQIYARITILHQRKRIRIGQHRPLAVINSDWMFYIHNHNCPYGFNIHAQSIRRPLL